MTVLPFPRRRPAESRPGGQPLVKPVTVGGSSRSPSGRSGTFLGSYRLERLVWDYGEPAATGVVTGTLTDADGTLIGTGSRRHTSAVDMVELPGTLRVRLGPLDVDIVGFAVAIDAFTVDVE